MRTVRNSSRILEGVPGIWGCTWSRGGDVSCLGVGCNWSQGVYLVLGSVPGPGVVYLVPGGCTWSRGCTWSLGGVPGPGGVPGTGGCTWSQGGVPGPGGVPGVYFLHF